MFSAALPPKQRANAYAYASYDRATVDRAKKNEKTHELCSMRCRGNRRRFADPRRCRNGIRGLSGNLGTAGERERGVIA